MHSTIVNTLNFTFCRPGTFEYSRRVTYTIWRLISPVHPILVDVSGSVLVQKCLMLRPLLFIRQTFWDRFVPCHRELAQQPAQIHFRQTVPSVSVLCKSVLDWFRRTNPDSAGI